MPARVLPPCARAGDRGAAGRARSRSAAGQAARRAVERTARLGDAPGRRRAGDRASPGLDAPPRRGLRRARRRAAPRGRAAGLGADGLAAQRGRRRGPGRVCDGELADRAAAADARQPRPRAGPVGASARALLRHARIPGAERQPSPGPGNISARMSESFVRKSLEGFRPYIPGEQPPDGQGWVKLNTNESPVPPSPRVIEAIRSAAGDDLRLYPSPTAAPAREAIARKFGLDPSQVIAGNGG